MPSLPLDGIRVLDLGISTAGPYAARFLGDLGAEILKIEPLDGENSRKLGLRYGKTGYLFHVNNYNKKSVTLQVQHPKGRAIFLDLVRQSDVVIENFAIGTMDKWGIGYEACRAANRSIIYCSAKGFGESGPLKNKKAFDTVTQAISGIMHMTGAPGEQPLKGGPSICDLMTAAASSMAVMSALAARRKGESQFLDTALFDMGIWSLMWLWPLAANRAALPLQQLGNKHPLHAPFGAYAASDGRVFVTVTSDTHWTALAPLLDLPGVWIAAERKRHEDEIDRAVTAWIAPMSAWGAADRLQRLGIPAAPVLDLGQVAKLDLLKRRNMVADVDHPVYGSIPLIQTPLSLGEDTPKTMTRLQPVLGQHNEEVIGGLLQRAPQLDELRREGVIG